MQRVTATTRHSFTMSQSRRDISLLLDIKAVPDGEYGYQMIVFEPALLGRQDGPAPAMIAMMTAPCARQVVHSLEYMLGAHPERSYIREAVMKPLPPFVSPHFRRFMRAQNITVVYDDRLVVRLEQQPALPSPPLRPLHEQAEEYARRSRRS